MKEQYQGITNSWEMASIKEERTRASLLSISAILSSMPLLLLLLFGGWRVISGTITTGVLYVFINLSGNVSGVMMNMPNHVGAFRRFIANLKRL